MKKHSIKNSNQKFSPSNSYKQQVSKTFRKLLKKDRVQLEAINKKIDQSLSGLSQFKPLIHPLLETWILELFSVLCCKAASSSVS